jgi:2-methylcitrate dehydratase
MEGDVNLRSFDDDHLANADLIALTNKVKLHRDPACNAGYPKGIPNRITVTLADGRQLVNEVVYPRGHSGNPMTDAEVEKKFRTVVEPRYGKPRADQILKMCWELEKLTNAGDLTKLLD